MSSSALNNARRALLAAALAGHAFGFAVAGPAAAQDACEHFAWSVRPEQALFAAPDLRTVASGAVLGAQDSAATLQLQPNAAVHFVLPPARRPKTADSYGGVISLANLAKAGIYQVTLSAEAWIDVIQAGKAAASAAHTGKRDCADVRKSVRFELEPGPVTIQVSGAAAAQIKLAVLPAE